MVGAPTQINPEYSTECTVTQTKDLWSFPCAPFWWVLKSWRTLSIVATSRTFLSPDRAARLFDFIFRFFTVPWASVLSPKHEPSVYKVLFEKRAKIAPKFHQTSFFEASVAHTRFFPHSPLFINSNRKTVIYHNSKRFWC